MIRKLVPFIFMISAYALDSETNLEPILAYASTSVKEIKSEALLLHLDRVYIEDDLGNRVSLSNLVEDDSSIYLEVGSRASPQPFWICTNSKCGTVHFYPPEKCRNCEGVAFDVRYK